MARPNIFTYDDLGAFLRDYVAWLKSSDKSVSYRRMAAEIGSLTPQGVHLIVAGKRLPSESALKDIASYLKLSYLERTYAHALVQAEKPTDAAQRADIKEALASLRRQGHSHTIDFDRFELMGSWHHVAILEMLDLADFRPDPAWISARLTGKITPLEAEKSLALLLRLGLMVETRPTDDDAAKGFRRVDDLLCTVDHQPAESVRKHHKEMLALAAEALDRQPLHQRMIKGLTLSISSDKIGAAQEAINNFLSQMVSLTHSSQGDETYQLGVQFFSLTQSPSAPPSSHSELPGGQSTRVGGSLVPIA